MNITENDIEKIIQQVLVNITSKPSEDVKKDATPEVKAEATPLRKKYLGVFEKAEDAIEAASKAQKKLLKEFKIEDRERFIISIKKATVANAEILARMIIDETGMGKYEDKVLKHKLVSEKTPGTDILTTEAWSGDNGLTIVEMAPYGVIGAVTPSTNPSETAICNSIGMIGAGNSVVFNAHPGAKECVAYAVDMMNKAIVEAGGPENLITMVAEPTMESLEAIMKHPEIRLLCGTGGPGLVKTLLSSGKKAIGAGAGNPPVIVDDTANVKKAGKDIIEGCSFDNNLPCIAEKEVFVFENVADDLIYHMLQNKAYMLTKNQVEELVKIVLHENIEEKAVGCSLDRKRHYVINKKWVGKDAALYLKALGIEGKDDIQCLICEVDLDHPFVMTELMMPILPIVRVKGIDQAIAYAKKAEHGNRHSAHMHSKNVDNLTRFAREIETTIFVKNAKSFAGVGFGGEGFTTFTIAGPTGEGITSARTFTRQRRCVLAEGFSII
ncbi:aldehyde dehydrogenase family protein [Desnuesiella massiliensis]|uniref:aldehyde dehydrogenase family protein n=1 Tax=Desnuesiella massiliensis TaxID=1650662 RepID=UPI0006E37BD1|nr:aldehyde dehydrogenase family protein [Desnuesiella massiliensis]